MCLHFFARTIAEKLMVKQIQMCFCEKTSCVTLQRKDQLLRIYKWPPISAKDAVVYVGRPAVRVLPAESVLVLHAIFARLAALSAVTRIGISFLSRDSFARANKFAFADHLQYF